MRAGCEGPVWLTACRRPWRYQLAAGTAQSNRSTDCQTIPRYMDTAMNTAWTLRDLHPFQQAWRPLLFCGSVEEARARSFARTFLNPDRPPNAALGRQLLTALSPIWTGYRQDHRASNRRPLATGRTVLVIAVRGRRAGPLHSASRKVFSVGARGAWWWEGRGEVNA